MNASTHQQLANFIWKICNLLRGPYKRNEYRKVILPLTVLRRFDCVLANTKEAVLAAHERYADQPDTVREPLLEAASGLSFYNTSKLDFDRLLDDPNLLAQNLNAYIGGFSENVREIIDRFGFADHIGRMDEKNLLYEVVKAFAGVDLSVERVDNMQMGYVFEGLIRIGAEQSNEEAGEHFTPREVIRLMVSLLLSPERDLGKSHVVKTIYDPACGTGGMLSVAEEHLLEHNRESRPILYGQDYNDEAWAVCKSDMLLKGQDAENIIRGDTFTEDGFSRKPNGQLWTFDYMLANPPFGVEWKQQQHHIKNERDSLGFDGRFGAGTPRINDGSLLFLQHMLSKMQPVADDGEGGSRIAIVFNGSPLFTGDAGSGESEIRRWIIENDWLEAIVALPDQMFYNTGIATYIWVLTNRKESRRVGKVQLIDGRQFFEKMRRSLGKKRNELSQVQLTDLTTIHGNFTDGETRDFTDVDPVTHQPRTQPRVVSRVFDNSDFGFQKITVERPLRLNFAAVPERIDRLDYEKAFINLAASKKREGPQRDTEVAAGQRRQESLRALLEMATEETSGEVWYDRDSLLKILGDSAKSAGVKLTAAEKKAVVAALGERDLNASICRDKNGNPEPDPKLRDTETVPLNEAIDDFMAREVLPHFPDAWVDHAKTRIGYEVPLNRHFYVYQPPRPSNEIEADLQKLEHQISGLITALIARTVTKGLPADVAQAKGFDPAPRLKPSGVEWLGEVPEHWEVVQLGRLGSFFKGGGGTKEDEVEGGLPCIRYGDLYTQHRFMIRHTRAGISEASASRYKKLQYGDLLFAGSGETIEEIGKSAVNLIEGPAYCGGDVIGFRPHVEIDATFLGYATDCSTAIYQKACMGRGVTVMHIYSSELKYLVIPLPPIDEQRAIAEFIERQMERIATLVTQLETATERLQEYRMALVTAAVTGKIDMKDWEPVETGVTA